MYAIAIHGGAGALPKGGLSPERQREYRQSLSQALTAGQALLERAGNALDAVEAAVTALEDDPLFNAGRGAVLCEDGSVELDAAIMSGSDLRAGAVAGIRYIRNPIRLARRVMEKSPHVFLTGAGAEAFADVNGFERVPNEYFITPLRSQQLQALLRPASTSGPAAVAALDEPPLGTVGAVARDSHGRLAAATSTGGMTGKLRGRIGDSPVIGAGTYADDRSCAVSTTGHGEWFLRTVQAYDIAARLNYGGYLLADAVNDAIAHRLTRLGATGGLIAVNRDGEIVMRYNTPAMFRACVRRGEPATIEIE
ncbi:MAG TPA: isoaspartyl peptidase/L-asparaginase [Steroidobacteraceae bacterium]|jgi:beta-aspartyl-peptidase (threonine type)|nr:isoaspartyl peptidase/L-asparaginase [Steroidobacteraceae bacterium]